MNMMHRAQVQGQRKTATALESYPEEEDRPKNSRAPLPNRRSPATRQKNTEKKFLPNLNSKEDNTSEKNFLQKNKDSKTPVRYKSLKKGGIKTPINGKFQTSVMTSAKQSINANPLEDMSKEQLEQNRLQLLDKNFLMDKSVKKMSLASVKRKQAQIEKEQRDANIAMMLANGTDQTPYRSSMNQQDQQKSIKQLKTAFKDKKINKNFKSDKFGLVEERQPQSQRESVFKG